MPRHGHTYAHGYLRTSVRAPRFRWSDYLISAKVRRTDGPKERRLSWEEQDAAEYGRLIVCGDRDKRRATSLLVCACAIKSSSRRAAVDGPIAGLPV